MVRGLHQRGSGVFFGTTTLLLHKPNVRKRLPPFRSLAKQLEKRSKSAFRPPCFCFFQGGCVQNHYFEILDLAIISKIELTAHPVAELVKSFAIPLKTLWDVLATSTINRVLDVLRERLRRTQVFRSERPVSKNPPPQVLSSGDIK